MDDEARRAGVAVAEGRLAFGAQAVLRGADLVVPEGSIVALLGPSGCGKTTLLRSIAGLERVDAGVITVAGAVVDDAGAVFVAPERRGVGMVFQDWALFPHLTVAENVGYGVRDRARRAAAVEENLARVGLAGLGDRLPGTLSGGQKQRVALARALAPAPAVLLLDEPFSNLDPTLRNQLRAEVRTLLAGLGVTAVFVTHDQEEAFVVGDEVAVMSDGVIVQQAPPADVYATPATPWLASFVGEANLLPGAAEGTTATTPVGPVVLREAARGDVQVLVRPEGLTLSAGDAGTVEWVEFHGHDVRYRVRLDDATTVTARAPGAPRHHPGDRVVVEVDPSPTVAWPSDRAMVAPDR